MSLDLLKLELVDRSSSLLHELPELLEEVHLDLLESLPPRSGCTMRYILTRCDQREQEHRLRRDLYVASSNYSQELFNEKEAKETRFTCEDVRLYTIRRRDPFIEDCVEEVYWTVVMIAKDICIRIGHYQGWRACSKGSCPGFHTVVAIVRM